MNPASIMQDHTLASSRTKQVETKQNYNPICTTNSSNVRASVGTDNTQGDNLTSLIFQNLSNCNLSVSATATFICANGNIMKLQNSIRSSGLFTLKAKQLLYVSYNVTSVFPMATQQCFSQTGFRSNLVWIDHWRENPINVVVLTSTP
jgi:endonuclease III-like uncharacterized protein